MGFIFLLGIILSIIFYNKLSYKQKNDTPLGIIYLGTVAAFGIALTILVFGV